VKGASDWMARFKGLSRRSPDVRATLVQESRVATVPKDTVIFGPGKAPENLLLRERQALPQGAGQRPLTDVARRPARGVGQTRNRQEREHHAEQPRGSDEGTDAACRAAVETGPGARALVWRAGRPAFR
jgi:hypothetical protein